MHLYGCGCKPPREFIFAPAGRLTGGFGRKIAKKPGLASRMKTILAAFEGRFY